MAAEKKEPAEKAAPQAEKSVEKTAEKPAEKAAPQVKKAPFTVAAGKSLVAKKRVISAGDEVRADMFPGGQVQLDELVKKKLVDKN